MYSCIEPRLLITAYNRPTSPFYSRLSVHKVITSTPHCIVIIIIILFFYWCFDAQAAQPQHIKHTHTHTHTEAPLQIKEGS